jgi:hypothetical protein
MAKSYSNGGNVYLPTILWYTPTTTPRTTTTTTLNSFIVLIDTNVDSDETFQCFVFHHNSFMKNHIIETIIIIRTKVLIHIIKLIVINGRH